MTSLIKPARALALLFLVVGLTTQAFAAKKDTYLRNLLNSHVEAMTQPITVIALFHDRLALPRTDHVPMGHAQIESALMQNARASQAATIKKLITYKETGAAIKATSLWLFNAMILTVPASEVKTLDQNPDIAVLVSNRRLRILTDEHGGPVPSAGEPFTYGLQKLNIPALREKAPNINGVGIKVGILDTGIDASHPDLAGRLIAFKDFVGGRTQPYDDNSHGTHVAGTISGGQASGTAIGVAPGVKLIVGKIFGGQGSANMDDILKGMQWMADPDGNPQTPDYPRIVSNSWGGGTPEAGFDPVDEPFCKAISAWVKLGIIPIFAAGNAGPGQSSVNLPGACPQAFAIGATDENDKVASFSSRGPAHWKSGAIVKPNVSAPGVQVLSSVPGGGYKAYSGTSMATPHAAGVAALVVQTVPTASVETVEQLMMSGAQKLGDPNSYGVGRLDAFNSVKNALILLHSGGIR